MAGFDKYVKSLLHCTPCKFIENFEIYGNYPSISKTGSKYNQAWQTSGSTYLKYKDRLQTGDADFTIEFEMQCNIQSSGIIFQLNNMQLSILGNILTFKNFGESLEYLNQYKFSVTEYDIHHIVLDYNYTASRIQFFVDGHLAGTLISRVSRRYSELVLGIDLTDMTLSEFHISSERKYKHEFDSNTEQFPNEYSLAFLKFKTALPDSISDITWIAEYSPEVSLNAPFKYSVFLSNDCLTSSVMEINFFDSFCIDGWFYLLENTGSIVCLEDYLEKYLELSFKNELLILQINTKYINVSGTVLNKWTHFAITYDSLYEQLVMYLDGQLKQIISDIEISPFQGNVLYGNKLNGYLSELRISEGVPRFVTNFQPEKFPYSESFHQKGTSVLLHFNDSSLKDERGNHWKLIDDSLHYANHGAYLDRAVLMYEDKQYLYSDSLILGNSDFSIKFWTTVLVPDNLTKSGTIFWLSNTSNTRMLSLSVDYNSDEYVLSVLDNSVIYSYRVNVQYNSLQQLLLEYDCYTNSLRFFINNVSQIIGNTDSVSVPVFKRETYRIYIGNDVTSHSYYAGTLNNFQITERKLSTATYLFDNMYDDYSVCFLPLDLNVQQDFYGQDFRLIEHSYNLSDNLNKEYLQDFFRDFLVKDSVFGKAIRIAKYQYIKSESLIYLGGQDFTIDIWSKLIKFSEHEINSDEKLLFYNQVYFEIFNGNTKLQLVRVARTDYSALIIEDSTGKQYRISSQVSVVNGFHHFAITYDFISRLLYFFIDGQLIQKLGVIFNRTAFSILLGKSTDNKRGYFSGIFDEFRILDGIALWNSNFSVPVEESYLFKNTDDFVLSLLHFDETPEKDEAGNTWNIVSCNAGVSVSNINYPSAYFDGQSCLFMDKVIVLGKSDFLISFSIFAEELSSAQTTRIFQIFNTPNTFKNSIHCYIENKSQHLYIAYHDNIQLISKSVIPLNTFVHIDILFKKDLNLIVLYIDKAEDNIMYKNILTTEYLHFVIGHSGSDTSEYSWYNSFFKGYIKNFIITENIDDLFDSNIIENYSFKYPDLLLIKDEHTLTLQDFSRYNLRDAVYENNIMGDWFLRKEVSSVLLHLDSSFLDFFNENQWQIIGKPKITYAPVPLFEDEVVSYAFYNDGSPNYMTTTSVPLTSIYTSPYFKISFFIFLNSLDNQGFLSSDMSNEYWTGFAITCVNKYLRFSVEYDNSYHEFDFFKLETGKWIHVTFIRDGQRLAGYKDGKLLKVIENFSDIQGTDLNQLNIGYWYRYGGYLNGFIREVQVAVLSEKERIPITDNIYVPVSVRDILTDNIIQTETGNSFRLFENQYLEKYLKLSIQDSFTVECKCVLDENQILFNLYLNQDNYLVLYTEDSNLFFNLNNEINFIEEDFKGEHILVIQYNINTLRIFTGQADITTRLSSTLLHGEYKLYLGYNFNTETVSGVSQISVFKISDFCCKTYQFNSSSQVFSESDVVHLEFTNSVTEDLISDNFWKIHGKLKKEPCIVTNEYTRFGNSLYIPSETALVLKDSIEFGAADFTIDFWLGLVSGNIIIFSVQDDNNSFIISYSNECLYVSLNNQIASTYFDSKLFHVAIEYNTNLSLLSVFLNGNKLLSDIFQIPQFDNAVISLGSQSNHFDFYLDEFRWSNTVRHQSSIFLPETKPYSKLEYKKKLSFRNSSGNIERVTLYYDYFDKSYVVFDMFENRNVYAALTSDLTQTLVTKLNNFLYTLSKDQMSKKYTSSFRFLKSVQTLQYSNDNSNFFDISDLIIDDYPAIQLDETNNLAIYADNDSLPNLIEEIYVNIMNYDDLIDFQFSYFKENENYQLFFRYGTDSEARIHVEYAEDIIGLLEEMDIKDIIIQTGILFMMKGR